MRLRSNRLLLLLAGASALATMGTIGVLSRPVRKEPPTPVPPAGVFDPLAVALQPDDIPRPPADELPPLEPRLPADLDDLTSLFPEEIAHAADTFSWETFLALNWPATDNGTPVINTPPGLSGDNSTVWETWPDQNSLRRAIGDTTAPTPEILGLPPGTRILSNALKHFDDLVPASEIGPLVDQNGRHVRFETRLNPTAFNAATARLVPASASSSSFRDASTSDSADPIDEIRIQAAWKVLSPAEIAAGRFHAVEAILLSAPPGSATKSPRLERVTVGLVGMHIARKTPRHPDWIWSTFEHVDNCPTAGDPIDRAAYNFFNKTKPDQEPNHPPAPPWDPAAIEPPERRSQILRETPIPRATRAVNVAFQSALRAINPASVWQHYQLIGTQLKPTPTAAPTPAVLHNTVLENYLSVSSPTAASCIDCHSRATTPAGGKADFAFLLRPHGRP